MNWNLYWKKMA